MSGRWSSFGGGAGEPEPDVMVGRALEALDPARTRPRFWLDFRRGVLVRAAPELLRRRRFAELTVSDVVAAWSRTLVPAAVLTAAAATAVFLRSRPELEEPSPLRLEEVLREGIDAPLPEAVDLQIDVSFAAESF